jgi:protein-L-isoaspartate(D-aspartate) O-methyltransferase
MHEADQQQDHSMTDFALARKTMVDNQLRTAGITDRRLLAAMGEVPRERFVPDVRKTLAYIDEAQPVGGHRKLAAPAPFAKLVQLAEVDHTDRVLDVGCGAGYSSAVLGRLAEHVVAVEDDEALVAQARVTLAELNMGNVEVASGPLTTAGATMGPYDVIVLEGAVAEVPQEMLSLLKPEGRLVALIAPPGKVAVAHLFAKSGEGIAASAAFDAKLPPLMPPAEQGFVF